MITSRNALLALLLMVSPAAAQNTGGIIGKIVDASNDHVLTGVTVRLNGGRYTTQSTATGEYRFRTLPAGIYAIEVVQIGYRPEHRDSVRVNQDESTRLDVRLAPQAANLPDLRSVGIQDPVLDPLATATEQRVTAEDFRRLPIASLADAVALQAGVVGESWRGGRVGQQALLLDGLSIKNQIDASTGAVGLKIPPDIIEEASIITNGFSARYGQSVSGLLSVTTRDGGSVWRGRAAYETDRPMTGSADLGLDRLVLEADGPLKGKITAVGILDFSGQLDADPANAPAPADPRDPRHSQPGPLPHNSGETWTGGGKLTIPMGELLTTRIFGLASRDQRLLYDPRYKYDPEFGPGQRVDGTLFSGSIQLVPQPGSALPIHGEMRIGYFSREFARGAVDQPKYQFGAFTGQKMTIRGEDFARAQDTVGTRGIVPGFEQTPQFSDRTPWGVAAFFLGGAPSGEISWNRFTELRTQLDGTAALASNIDLNGGVLYASQNAKTFQRVLAHMPVGGSVPAPTATTLAPTISSAYLEMQTRFGDLGISGGVRFDAFDPGGVSQNKTLTSRSTLNPRLAVSTALNNASFVASIGRFSQPPDIQYLVNAAFDDTTRTGRFREGNPNLGFESATQFELSARVRLQDKTSIKTGVYYKKLDGLVSSVPFSVNADSSQFINADNGDVEGLEVILEFERYRGWRARFSGVYQKAMATVTDAFQLKKLAEIDPITHDTMAAPRAQFPLDYDRRIGLIATVDGEFAPTAGPRIFGVYPAGGLTIATATRYVTGLPYSRTDASGKIVGEINGERLPAQFTVDALIRRPIRIGHFDGGIYLDVRNVLNRRNEISVRRDTGTPYASPETIDNLVAQNYRSDPIPYESPRYRAYADPGHTGLISGSSMLTPLFQAAAIDYSNPIFYFGPPRQFRFGVELVF